MNYDVQLSIDSLKRRPIVSAKVIDEIKKHRELSMKSLLKRLRPLKLPDVEIKSAVLPLILSGEVELTKNLKLRAKTYFF